MFSRQNVMPKWTIFKISSKVSNSQSKAFVLIAEIFWRIFWRPLFDAVQNSSFYHQKSKFSWYSKQNHLYFKLLKKLLNISPLLFKIITQAQFYAQLLNGRSNCLALQVFFATFVFQRWTIFSTILMSNGNHFFVIKNHRDE